MNIAGHRLLSDIESESLTKSFRQILENCGIESVEELVALESAVSSRNITLEKDFRQNLHSAVSLLQRTGQVSPKMSDRWTSPSPQYALSESQCEGNGALRDPSKIDTDWSNSSFPSHFLLDTSAFPPVYDQKDDGICAACAATAMVEYHHKPDVRLEPYFLYYMAKKFDGHSKSEGASLKEVLMCAENFGVCPASHYKVTGEDFEEPDVERAKKEAERYKTGHRSVFPGVIDSYVEVLTGDNRFRPTPIAVSLKVFDSWRFSLASASTGKLTFPLPGEKPNACTHCLLIIGYQRDSSVKGGGYFLARNSWGTSWGERTTWWGTNPPIEMPGHAIIPFAYAQLYVCEAFAGPEISLVTVQETEGEKFQRLYCRTLSGNEKIYFEFNEGNAGKQLHVGNRVIANPDFPNIFKEYSVENMKEFEQYGFQWLTRTQQRQEVEEAIHELMQNGYGTPGRGSLLVGMIVEKTGFHEEKVISFCEKLARIKGYELYEVNLPSCGKQLAIRKCAAKY